MIVKPEVPVNIDLAKFDKSDIKYWHDEGYERFEEILGKLPEKLKTTLFD